jgi:hypothetical protein
MNIKDIIEMLKGNKEEKVEDAFEKAMEDAKGVAKGFSSFIFVTDNQCAVYGSGADILALLAVAINSLGEKGMPKEVVLAVVEAAYLSDEELAKKAKKCKIKKDEDIEKLKTIVEILGKDTDDE